MHCEDRERQAGRGEAPRWRSRCRHVLTSAALLIYIMVGLSGFELDRWSMPTVQVSVNFDLLALEECWLRSRKSGGTGKCNPSEEAKHSASVALYWAWPKRLHNRSGVDRFNLGTPDLGTPRD